MNFYNILLYIIIFVIIILSFYKIVDNYSYSNINLYSNKSESFKQYFSQLETKVNSIKNNESNDNQAFHETILKLKKDLDNLLSTITKNNNVINNEIIQTNITNSPTNSPVTNNNLVHTLQEKIITLESQINNIVNNLNK